MKRIVTFLKPFDMEQTIYVYQDGNKIAIKQTTLDNIKDKLFKMVEEYGASELNFIGGKFYAEKLIKEIKSQEMTKYNRNILKFKIM